MSKNWESKSVDSLKEFLKGKGMTQTGDKGTLIHRCQLYSICEENGIMVNDGVNPCALKPADLKKCVARNGLSPIGSNDELLTSLVNLLKSKPPEQSLKSTEGENLHVQGESSHEGPKDVEIARRIIELDEVDDYEGILNIAGGVNITKQTPAAIMRKAYLKLSLVIHPDKLQKKFDQSTKAFQALVRAYERLSQPLVEDDVFMEATKTSKGTAKSQTKTISRSNEGCYRTRVCCPRCKQPWSEGTLDGNPEYFYNFLMTGLKQYTCSTCLFEFGCLTALHKCPLCKGLYEYSPQDYHRKIKCGNKKCTQEFGFYMFHVSDRALTDMKLAVKLEQEEIAKVKRTKQRRATGRAANRNADCNDLRTNESAFVLGLIDCCPRCGEMLEDYGDEDCQRQHLMNCTDEVKHSEFKAKVEKKRRRDEEREEKKNSQMNIQTKAAWEFLGSKTSQLYLLDEVQLRSIAMEQGLDVSGDQEDLVVRITEFRSGESSVKASDGGKVMLLEDDADKSQVDYKNIASAAVVVRQKKRRISGDDLPSNLYSMTIAELRAICASHRIPVAKGTSKADIISEIEDALCDES